MRYAPKGIGCETFSFEILGTDAKRASRYLPRKHVRSHDFSTYADLCCLRETRSAQTITSAAKLNISKNRSTLYRLWGRYLLALSAVYWRNTIKMICGSSDNNILKLLTLLYRCSNMVHQLIGSIAQRKRATSIFFENDRGVE